MKNKEKMDISAQTLEHMDTNQNEKKSEIKPVITNYDIN